MIVNTRKLNGQKKCVIKRRFVVKNYKDCLLNNKIILKSQQRFKSDHHNVYTEQISKIALSSNDYKTNAFLNLINSKPGINKIYLYAKDPYEAKYQFLFNKRESTGLKHLNDPKAFVEYSKDM